jgi:dethiobiotin synthetase
MHGVFITGTDTNVGKTYVGVALARTLRERDIEVIPRKPIESGCELVNGELVPADARALMDAAGYTGSLYQVCPYRFEPPISPVRAAHLASKVLTTEQLVKNCLEGSENGFVLVEGAGGFYSPLAEDGLNADLATALQLPVLLVADDSLGVLNQVLLNVEAIKVRGLHLAGVVLSRKQPKQDDRMDNAADLRNMLNTPVFSLEHCPDGHCKLSEELINRVLSDKERRRAHRLAG